MGVEVLSPTLAIHPWSHLQIAWQKFRGPQIIMTHCVFNLVNIHIEQLLQLIIAINYRSELGYM